MHAEIDELFIKIDAKLERIRDRLHLDKVQVRRDMAGSLNGRLDRIDVLLESISKRVKEKQP
jgi:hypothetical protein